MCDMPAAFEETHRIARKPHRCEICGHTIPSGSRYYVAAGLWDGRWDRVNAHVACQELYRDVQAAETGYECLAYEELRERIEDARMDVAYVVRRGPRADDADTQWAVFWLRLRAIDNVFGDPAWLADRDAEENELELDNRACEAA